MNITTQTFKLTCSIHYYLTIIIQIIKHLECYLRLREKKRKKNILEEKEYGYIQVWDKGLYWMCCVDDKETEGNNYAISRFNKIRVVTMLLSLIPLWRWNLLLAIILFLNTGYIICIVVVIIYVTEQVRLKLKIPILIWIYASDAIIHKRQILLLNLDLMFYEDLFVVSKRCKWMQWTFSDV